MKTRNLIISAAILFVCLTPAFLFCIQKVHVDVPSWLTSEDAVYLSGGKTDVDLRSKANFGSIMSGEFQSAFEAKVNNYIPAKASALLGNAAVQRCAIAASNRLFGWECYPTSYGSKHVIEKDESRIWQIAIKGQDSLTSGIDALFNALTSTASDNKEVDFLVYCAPCARDVSPYNPSNQLTSNAIQQDAVIAMMEKYQQLSSRNLFFLTKKYDSEDDFGEEYYKYDHHWNIKGAISAYEEICDALDIEKTDFNDISVMEDSYFIGSQARESLTLFKEPVFDTSFDFGQLSSCSYDLEYQGQCDLHERYWSSNTYNRVFDFHELYFGDMNGCAILGGNGERNILLVSDSFGNAPIRLLAQSSNVLYTKPALYNQTKGSTVVRDFIDSGKVDTVILIARYEDLATFMNNNPDCFGSE